MNAKIKVPILAYHHVLPVNAKVDESIKNSPFTISDAQFYEQMLFLSQNGYQPINFSQLLNSMEKLEVGKPIVITFDDGWVDNFEYAYPTLKAFGVSATFFVITGHVNSSGCMSWKQLNEMQNHNMEIASHTHSHTPLELLSNSELQWELTHSKNLLDENIGKNSARLSFPHGSYSKIVLNAAKNAGYLSCATSNFGYVTSSSKVYELPRILIRKSHDISQFVKVCEADKLSILKSKIIQKSKALLKSTVGIEKYQGLYKIRNRIKRPTAFD